MKYIYIRRYF